MTKLLGRAPEKAGHGTEGERKGNGRATEGMSDLVATRPFGPIPLAGSMRCNMGLNMSPVLLGVGFVV